MDAKPALEVLVTKGFKIAGESVPLGFDTARIAPTLAKLPGGTAKELEPLFKTSWPSDSFSLGVIELLGPARINEEHETLLPGSLIVKYGFVCIGSDHGGMMYSYCVDDGRVYLVPHEYVAEDAVYTEKWDKLEPSQASIKLISEQSWDSMGALFEWSAAELAKIEAEREREGAGDSPTK